MPRQAWLAALLACGAAGLTAQEPPGDQLRRLLASASATSASGGLAAGLAPHLDSAVTYLHPGAPVVRGGAAARALLATVPGADLVVTWYTEEVLLSADGALGVTWGLAIAQPRGAGAMRSGNFLAVWRNGAAGWRIEALVFAGVLPDAPAGTAATTLPTARGAAAPFFAADSAFAALAGRSDAPEAFFQFAAPDAVTFGRDGRVNRGPAAIRSALRPGATWSWAPVVGAAAPGGDMGWTVGEAAITPPGGGTFYGKYLTVWRTTPAGPLFVADAGNARPAPAP
jgi:ketosteroid isomerase-like protein